MKHRLSAQFKRQFTADRHGRVTGVKLECGPGRCARHRRGASLRFEVDTLPATSYATDLRAGMDSGAADYGVDALYSIPPADVVPDAVTIETEPGTGVEIEVVHRAVLQAIAIVSRAPRGNGGRVERRARIVTPARRRLWL